MVTKTLIVVGDPLVTAPPGRQRGAMLRAYDKKTSAEVGAVWMPAWLERLEIVKDTFGRTESRIRDLSLRPVDYVRRQIRVTPYPTEDVGRRL